jgi:hypothetical protein
MIRISWLQEVQMDSFVAGTYATSLVLCLSRRFVSVVFYMSVIDFKTDKDIIGSIIVTSMMPVEISK